MNKTIRFTNEELQDVLMHNLTGPHKDLLGECINALAGDADWKSEKLLKAALGIKPKSVHRLHDEYLVSKNDISVYDMDTEATKAAGLLSEDGKFTCLLIAFNPWELSQYKISYKYIKSSGEEYDATYDCMANYLKVAEEFPEDFD
jgi:hypothetical protein